MSGIKHKVDEQAGGSVHSEVPAARPAEEFDVSRMSGRTRTAWRNVCEDGNATPEDFRHVFESIMGSKVVTGVLK